jgi:tRNA-dihydrouridine synthase B
MQTPGLAGRIVRAVVDAVGSDALVSVKMRKGWDSLSVSAVELAKICEANGAAAVTVHGRTRAQLYSGTSDPEIIRQVKQAVAIPVAANGDIASRSDAVQLLDCTGADFAMIGRAAMGNPWIFSSAADSPPTLTELMNTALSQAERAAEYKPERVACMEARKHFAWYLRGVPNASRWKVRFAQAVTLDELCEIVLSFRA